jgi:repressor LexA
LEKLTEKQKAVLEFLAEHARQHGYPPSVRELCGALGLKSPNSAHAHLKALRDKGYIRMASGINRGITLLKRPESGRSEAPVLGRVAAGPPVLSPEHEEESIGVDKSFFGGKDLFSVRVTGDSMEEAHIQDGDHVFLRPQKTARNGDIVAALVEDEVTLKYFYKTPEGVELRPANARYRPFVFREEDGARLEILGVMVGLVRRL